MQVIALEGQVEERDAPRSASRKMCRRGKVHAGRDRGRGRATPQAGSHEAGQSAACRGSIPKMLATGRIASGAAGEAAVT